MEENVLNIIKSNFQFLEDEFNYARVDDIYGKDIGSKYKYARVYYNDLLSLKISIIYYDENPIKVDKSKEIAFQVIIFKNGNHIDFSRLLKNNNTFSKFCKHQYFILQYDKNKIDLLRNFLKLISKELLNNHKGILIGQNWIDIDYNLRDDY